MVTVVVKMEEPAEIAALTSEYITSLDNVPLEVSHVMREIELKEGKVHDVMTKIASREAQMDDLFKSLGGSADSSSSLSESGRAKLEKLAARTSSDYARAEEWARQKSELAKMLWQRMQAHYERLLSEIGRINPDLVESVAVTLPPSPKMPPVSGLTAALNEVGVGDADELGESRLKRKRAPGLGHPSNLSNLPGSTASYGRGVHARLGSVRNTQGDDVVDGREIDAHAKELGAARGDAEEERDENLYCFCQRGSFGEMIGCDSDDCKYEWFHIGCVGVSKPLPQTWVCSDCLAKNKKRRRG